MTGDTAAKDALLASYNRLRRAEEKRIELLPDRLQTMRADPDWIAAISEKNQALDAFVAAARTACVTWSAEQPNNG